ncbi:MAG: glycoside hydrolase family protein [Candidatus Margulisiibacteriota bacterium]|jgi:GH24 family phage-related lysozyme (muramidase)
MKTFIFYLMMFLSISTSAYSNNALFAQGQSMIKNFEGFQSCPYADNGQMSVGYGTDVNFLNKGLVCITKKEASDALNKRYLVAVKDAKKYLGDLVFNKLSPNRQLVIIDMSYNLGFNRLSKFKLLKIALTNEDYKQATKEMQNSKWYQQVNRRSKKLCKIMLTDKLN